ncbi:glycosyl transferase [Metapseudomonas resinovorans]|uniref:glycosyltransferase n=1 Tax=Metapseudomonas resinovorans TaxID=53412 RepID=UPI000986B41C|nr:glycosyltransferase [Pseudomonas resinovorans]GLZ88431.1 glycosyl transferase [Pseudomonas resinovorans]
MLRVLIFHPALAPYRLDLFNRLSELFELKIIFLQKNLISQSFDQKKLTAELKADFTHLTKGFRILNKNFRIGISSEIEEFKPDIVITPEFSPTTIITALRKATHKNFKHVVWTDDNPNFIKRESRSRRIIRSIVSPLSDGLVLTSLDAASIYRQSEIPTAIVPILQEELKFRACLAAAKSDAIELAKSHTLYNKKILLYVGRLSPEKRADRVITYFSELSELRDDIILVIVGDGPDTDNLKELATALNVQSKVIFTGRKEGKELLCWYVLGSVFILLSDFEAFGAVVNEALIAGLPVVCTQNAGAKTLIQEGVNGSIVNPDSPQQTISAINSWISKCHTIDRNGILSEKPSMMTTSFNDAITAYATLLKKLSRST